MFFLGPPVMGKKLIVGNAVPAQAGAKFIKHIDVHHLFESAYQLDKPLFLRGLNSCVIYIQCKLPIFSALVKEDI